MTKHEAQSAGGKAHAILERREALEAYYASPNLCQRCGIAISVRPHEKASYVRKKKFCGIKCYATGRIYTSRQRSELRKTCGRCLGIFVVKKNAAGAFHRRKFCQPCVAIIRRGSLGEKTKGELFKSRSSWQSARSAIRRHAEQIYRRSGLPLRCYSCGYGRHVEIAHKASVASFSASAKIEEINRLENLTPLCPTHHWEQENGFLELTTPWRAVH